MLKKLIFVAESLAIWFGFWWLDAYTCMVKFGIDPELSVAPALGGGIILGMFLLCMVFISEVDFEEEDEDY